MGEVIKLKSSEKMNDGNLSFLCCVCQNDLERPKQTFRPIIKTVYNGQLMAGLFCENCKLVLTIENGSVGHFIDENA